MSEGQASDGFPVNRFRAALERRRPLVGLWTMLNAGTAVEGLARAGFDWIMLDGEHTPMSLADAVAHLRILDASPSIPLVRVVWNDAVVMKQYLDAGATTIMVPYVQTADEAVAAVRAMRYPPRGARGVAVLHRASRYGRLADYHARAEESLFLIVQVETRAAIDRIEEIAAVDGVDALFFGPSDIAASIGLLGQPSHPDVAALIDDAVARARPSGKAMGALASNAEGAERHIDAGFDFVSVASDLTILFRTAEQVAARFTARAAKAVSRKPDHTDATAAAPH